MTIIKNTGIDATVVVEKIVNSPENIGYDAMEGQMVDLMKAGIIDPTKVGAAIFLKYFNNLKFAAIALK